MERLIGAPTVIMNPVSTCCLFKLRDLNLRLCLAYWRCLHLLHRFLVLQCVSNGVGRTVLLWHAGQAHCRYSMRAKLLLPLHFFDSGDLRNFINSAGLC